MKYANGDPTHSTDFDGIMEKKKSKHIFAKFITMIRTLRYTVQCVIDTAHKTHTHIPIYDMVILFIIRCVTVWYNVLYSSVIVGHGAEWKCFTRPWSRTRRSKQNAGTCVYEIKTKKLYVY